MFFEQPPARSHQPPATCLEVVMWWSELVMGGGEWVT